MWLISTTYVFSKHLVSSQPEPAIQEKVQHRWGATLTKKGVQIIQNEVWKLDNRIPLWGFHCPCLSAYGNMTFMHIYIKMLRTVQHLTLHQKQEEQRHSSKASVVQQQKTQTTATMSITCAVVGIHQVPCQLFYIPGPFNVKRWFLESWCSGFETTCLSLFPVYRNPIIPRVCFNFNQLL